MLNLSSQDVRNYWHSVSPDMARLFGAIEQTEDWTLDADARIGDRLIGLAKRLSVPNAAARLAAADKHDLLFFLVYISTSKAFRLIQWLDEEEDGLGSRLLDSLLDNDSADAFARVADPVLVSTLFRRLHVIQNTPFFNQLLDPSMLEGIQQAIQSYRDEREA